MDSVILMVLLDLPSDLAQRLYGSSSESILVVNALRHIGAGCGLFKN
jgi:hypothetical protein